MKIYVRTHVERARGGENLERIRDEESPPRCVRRAEEREAGESSRLKASILARARRRETGSAKTRVADREGTTPGVERGAQRDRNCGGQTNRGRRIKKERSGGGGGGDGDAASANRRATEKRRTCAIVSAT